SAAVMAVSSVFCALITNTGRSGRIFLMRGIRSNPLSSGSTTSVMTRLPSPADTMRHRPAAVPVVRTSYPARPSAWLSTVRMALSSSQTRMVAVMSGNLVRGFGQKDAEDGAARNAVALDHAAKVAHDLGRQRQPK